MAVTILQVFKCWLKKCLKHPVDQVNHSVTHYEQGNAAAREIKSNLLCKKNGILAPNGFYSVAWGMTGCLTLNFNMQNSSAIFRVNKASRRVSGTFQVFNKCLVIANVPKKIYYQNMTYQSENTEKSIANI